VRIGVLGPLRVEVAGRQVPVPGRLPRRLLAALVAHVGESSSLGTLISEVWGDDAPPTAVKTLQAYVARLRALIGVDTIATTQNGYRLMVPAQSIDAVVFTDLVRRATLAVEEGSPARAARLLTEAFGWWRGEPYAEFADMAVAVVERRRLTEVRLTGYELRIDAYLATGQELQAVAEVEALVTAHPLRERFWAQLMLALYRCGRQADALAAFQRARRLLAEEIGTDPGAALQALELQVLRQDPVLHRPDGRVLDAARAGTAGTVVERRFGTVIVAGIGPAGDPSRWEDPERVEAWLRRFRAACREAVQATGGVVTGNTEIGVVAAFGIVAWQDDQASRALDAALNVRAWCRETLHGLVAVRVGVASGGLARRGESAQVEVVGDPVRLANALCHAAGPDQILADERCVGLAHHRFSFTPAAAVDASAAAVLLGHRTPPWTRSIAGLPRVFVGRADELNELDEGYQRAVRLGKPFLLTVRGEPGIGKTTLVARFCDQVRHADPAATVHLGRCMPYGPGSSYEALADILRAHLDLPAEASSDEVRQRLSAVPILGLTFGLDIAAPPDPMTARSMLHRAWVQLVGEACRRGPVVLVIEDVHWAHPPLLDLVGDLLTEVSGPLLVVATARPEDTVTRHPAFGSGRHRTTMWLDRLSDEHAAAMLKEMLGEQPPDELRPAILARADGNPFFIEELLATLIEHGALTASPQGWQMADSPGDHLPDTVRAAVAVRIGRLSLDALATLQAAAVLGMHFTADLLTRLQRPSTVDLIDLVEADLVRPLPGGGAARYTFKHALVRQVTYDLLPIGRRVRLHAACADLLAAHPDAADSAAILAYHYAEAADPTHADLAWEGQPQELSRVREGALEWLYRAARQANRRYAGEEALQLLHRGLALDPPRHIQGKLWLEIGETYGLRMDSRHREPRLRGIALSDDPAAKAEAYADLANEYFTWGADLTPQAPVETVVEWASRAMELGPPESFAYGVGLLVRSLWLGEDLSLLAQRLLARARRIGDLFATGQSYRVAAMVATRERRHEEALEWYLKTIALFEADGANNPHITGYCHQYPLETLLALGRFAEARRYATRFEEVSATQSPAHLAHAVAWCVQIEVLAGEWERVRALEDRVMRSVRFFADRGTGITTVRALLFCATARARLGDTGRAARFEKMALGLGDDSDPRINAPWLRLALARHDLPEIRRLFASNHKNLPPYAEWWALDNLATRLDGLAALNESDQLAEESAPYQRTDPYLTAIAERALGTVHRDPVRLRAAARAFAAIGLPAQVRTTDGLADHLSLPGNATASPQGR
jgi:DNA-binding SARP family transcriptional activator